MIINHKGNISNIICTDRKENDTKIIDHNEESTNWLEGLIMHLKENMSNITDHKENNMKITDHKEKI